MTSPSSSPSAGRPPPERRPPEGVAQHGQPDLSRRAGLTLVSGLLRQGAGAAVSFLLLPVILRRLGPERYGVWVVIQQGVGYLAQADLRAMGALKATLAVQQHDGDIAAKRRLVGASLVIWGATVPLVLTIGAAAVWIAPRVVESTSTSAATTRATLLIVFVTFVLDRVLSLPAQVLRGMNLDFKGTGIDAAMTLLVGVLGVLAVVAGYGLVGWAAAGAIGMVAGNVARWCVARRALPWLGPDRPSRRDLSILAKRTGWMTLGDLSLLLLVGSDVLLVGIFVGPAAAGVFAATQGILRLAAGPVIEVLSSGGPGVADVAGRGDWERLRRIRLEVLRGAIGLMTIFGATVLVANEGFVSLWAGPSFYGGDTLTGLLVLAMFATVLARGDSMMADALMLFRQRAFATIVAGVIAVALGAVLVGPAGARGVAAASVLARLALVAATTALVHRSVPGTEASWRAIVRPAAATAVVFAASWAASRYLEPRGFIAVALAMIISSVAAGVAWSVIGLRPAERRAMIARVAAMARRTERPGA